MIDKKIFALCNSITEQEALNLKDDLFIAEQKQDGIRALGVIIDGEAIILTREGKIANKHFNEIVEELKTLGNCIIDGEIVAQSGKFEDTMKRANTQNTQKIKELTTQIPLYYEVFDLLKTGNEDIRTKPLTARRNFLESLFSDKDFKFCKVIKQGNIKEMLEIAKKNSQEGIVIKNLNSPYESRRSNAFMKLKLFKEMEIVVTKYEQNPSGIKVTSKDGIMEIQVAGKQSEELKELLDTKGEAEIVIQYLSINEETKKPRFPSYRGLKNGI
jgi:ATP-dependent DNA ligase